MTLQRYIRGWLARRVVKSIMHQRLRQDLQIAIKKLNNHNQNKADIIVPNIEHVERPREVSTPWGNVKMRRIIPQPCDKFSGTLVQNCKEFFHYN